MPTRVKKRYPAKDVIELGDKFFAFVKKNGKENVTDKEDLRSLYYNNFKKSLDTTSGVCGFSTLISFLKHTKKIKVRDGHIYQQKAYDSVSIDQYVTMRKAEQEDDEAGAAGAARHPSASNQKSLRPKKRYPCLCEVCGVKVNSEVVYRDHISGSRHRLNMLKKDINSRRNDLVLDKNDITITTPYDDGKGNVTTDVQKGETKNIKFSIKVKGEKEMALISVVLLRPHREFAVSDEHNVYAGINILRMPPGSDYEVSLTCQNAANLGRLSSPLVFAFRMEETREIFQILRFVSITVVSDVIADLPPSKPYTKPPSFAAREKKGEIVDGVRPNFSSRNPLKGGLLPTYDIPKELNKAVNNKRKLVELKQELAKPLSVENHCEKFHNLLYIEEMQMQVDIRRYDRHAQELRTDRRNPGMLKLHVPGLAENRPSVLKGDHLFARFSDKSDTKSYKGYVHFVEQEDVVLGFASEFRNKYVQGRKVDIEFTFSRYPLRNQHHAVETATAEGGLSEVLFPAAQKVGTRGLFPRVPEIGAFKNKVFDRKLADNMEQVQAVHSIVRGSSRPAPYLVFGPPGTGKTVTIVEATKQVYNILPESRILICAPSNSAADLVAVRLLNKGTPVAKTSLLRFYAPSRPLASIDPVLKDKKCCNFDGNELYVPNKQDIQSKRIIVTTLVTAGRLALAQFPPDFFTHVVIDEAGHATEPEALIALAGLLSPNNPLGGQVVLAGDPKQLGPVLRSPNAIEHGLSLSYLERLMTLCPVYSRQSAGNAAARGNYDERVLTKLLRNYRSHPDILQLPNQLFYDNELQVFADELVRSQFCTWDELPTEGFPIIFHGVEGQDAREEQSPSFFNLSEVDVVVNYVREVMEKRGGTKVKQEDIGVISPYRKQVQKLRQVLKKRGFNDIKVGSVEEFQGQERLVIIISTVRSTRAEFIQMDTDFKLGFLKNPKRFNVAVTRAKSLLIIVGNPFMLSKDENWNLMLEFCRQKGGYRGCPYSPEEGEVDDIVQLLQKVHLGTLPTVEEAMDGLQVSQVTEQNDPEWRGEV
ncbi:putative helicase MOV-10 [Diadema antillarum]|uniref:putative helicase MOV-10 n=1 Tax=Diadema antillarum TaxID=105358 RepID=UPI003A853877